MAVDYYSPRWSGDELVKFEWGPDRTKTPTSAVFADGSRADNITVLAPGIAQHEVLFEHDGVLHVFSHAGGHTRIPRAPPLLRRRRTATAPGFCNIAVFKTARCEVPDGSILTVLYAALSIVNPHLAPVAIAVSSIARLSSNPTTSNPDLALDEMNAAAFTALNGAMPCFTLVFDVAGALSEGAVGVAYVGAIDDTDRFVLGACSSFHITGLVTLESFPQAVKVTAHEIGHLLGLEHVDTPTMMNANVGEASGEFSPESSEKLGEWAAKASCLADTASAPLPIGQLEPASPAWKQAAWVAGIVTLATSATLSMALLPGPL